MNFLDIRNLIIDKFGESVVSYTQSDTTQPYMIIASDHISQVCQFLRDNPKTYFDFLSCLSGVDYFPENKMGVVYHLSSISKNLRLTLKVEKIFDRNSTELPVFPTVSNVWKTADWHEREAFDLFGIFFEGHEDLRRILLPDDWEGYPLRKDYKTAEYYKNIQIDY